MKYIIGISLGLIIGLPQAFDPVRNPYEVESLPHSTVYIIIAFGTISGVISGVLLLHNTSRPLGIMFQYLDKFIDFYSLITVCMLSIGIPIFLKVGFSDFYASALINGNFFLSVGIGLVLAGIGKLLWSFRAP
jgi:hypothetical protein